MANEWNRDANHLGDKTLDNVKNLIEGRITTLSCEELEQAGKSSRIQFFTCLFEEYSEEMEMFSKARLDVDVFVEIKLRRVCCVYFLVFHENVW